MSAPQSPRRWIEEGGSATPLERDLLRSALSLEPPPDAQKQVWAGVLAALPPPGGAPGPGHGGDPTGGHGGGAGGKAAAASKAAAAGKAAVAGKLAAGGAAAAAGTGLIKSALIGAGSALALIATYTVVTPATPTEPAALPAAAVVPSVAVAPAAPARRGGHSGEGPRALTDDPDRATLPPEAAATAPLDPPSVANASPERRSEPRPSTSAAEAPPAALAPVEATERETMLREENRQVSEARDALRRGDASGALTQLEQIRARFPGGVLIQEREALAIEALARSGRRADASARAAAFLQAYPTSLHFERVRAFSLGETPKPLPPAFSLGDAQPRPAPVPPTVAK